MWTVSTTPANYRPPNGEEWCIIDDNDGDIHQFYSSKEIAEQELKKLLGVI
jgi:hypothetical protein